VDNLCVFITGGKVNVLIKAILLDIFNVKLFTLFFIFFQRIYTAASVQIRRHETATKSPIYSQFGETISGTSTIRAYNQQERCIYNRR
jgi:ABC-type multidrug transport system fused ATPase/permease subunit